MARMGTTRTKFFLIADCNRSSLAAVKAEPLWLIACLLSVCCSAEAEELGRIVDQHALPDGLRWRDLRDQVHEAGVVRHRTAEVHMRPVGTPQDTLRRVRGDAARNRQ